MKEENFSVEEAFRQLDEINQKLSSPETALTESIEIYKEGVALAAKCREHLDGIEQELQIINKQNEEPMEK